MKKSKGGSKRYRRHKLKFNRKNEFEEEYTPEMMGRDMKLLSETEDINDLINLTLSPNE